VVEEEFAFILIRIDSDDVILEVQYGTKTLFETTATRGSDYVYADEGFRYVTKGDTVAILEPPSSDDIVIKPIIKSMGPTAPGDIDITMQKIKVKDITSSGTDLFEVVNESSTTVPVPEPGETYVDTDGDWVYDINDIDDDNDGIPDDRDPEPKIKGTQWINDAPNIDSIKGPEDYRVKKGDDFTLTVDAEDRDEDPISISWSISGSVSGWQANGESVIGPKDLDVGTYTFIVTVRDDKGAETTQTFDIEVYEEEEEGPDWLIYAIMAVVLVIIIIVVIFFLMKERSEDEDEAPEVMPPDIVTGEDEEGAGQEYDEMDEFDEMEEIETSMPPSPVMTQKVMAPSLEVEEEEMESEVEEFEEYETLDENMEEADETDEVQDLESLIDEMERTEEEVGDICPECASPLGPFDSECPNCGAQFELALECPNCGAVVEDNVSDCPSCGVSFI
jgi:hypothetical protein